MTGTHRPSDLRRALEESGLFEAEWYVARHPEAAAAGRDPMEYFCTVGLAMNHSPGPAHHELFLRHATTGWTAGASVLEDRLRGRPVVIRPGRVLYAAAQVAKAGDHDEALRLAGLHLERPDRPARLVLQANKALLDGDRAGWLRALDSYLAPFDVAPVRLRPGAGLLDRLTTDPLPPVQDDETVSVLMAVWNAERTVEAAVRSVLRQTWRNLELLIVDDASTDGTWAVLRRLASGDGRVRLVRNHRNVGPYVSKNRALAAAQGAWVTGQDGDDWSHPQRLERHMRLVRAAGGTVQASGALILRMSEAGHIDIGLRGPASPDGVMRRGLIACLFRTDMLRQRLGAWDSVRFGADAELVWRAERLLDDGFRDMPVLAMLCLQTAESLTGRGVSPFEPGTREPRHRPDADANPGAAGAESAEHGPLITPPAMAPEATLADRTAIRSAYVQAFRDWQARAASEGASLRMAFPQPSRPFPAPAEMVVPAEDVLYNLS